jgi:hypothetical protein
MNKTYLMSMDTIKTFAQGALGAMTFGAYHQYTTNKIMEINNERINERMALNNDRIALNSEKMELIHRNEIEQYNSKMKTLEEKITQLEKRRWF